MLKFGINECSFVNSFKGIDTCLCLRKSFGFGFVAVGSNTEKPKEIKTFRGA